MTVISDNRITLPQRIVRNYLPNNLRYSWAEGIQQFTQHSFHLYPGGNRDQ